jgi:hypothetical protein
MMRSEKRHFEAVMQSGALFCTTVAFLKSRWCSAGLILGEQRSEMFSMDHSLDVRVA